jgi:hypothetical protein
MPPTCCSSTCGTASGPYRQNRSGWRWADLSARLGSQLLRNLRIRWVRPHVRQPNRASIAPCRAPAAAQPACQRLSPQGGESGALLLRQPLPRCVPLPVAVVVVVVVQAQTTERERWSSSRRDGEMRHERTVDEGEPPADASRAVRWSRAPSHREQALVVAADARPPMNPSRARQDQQNCLGVKDESLVLPGGVVARKEGQTAFGLELRWHAIRWCDPRPTAMRHRPSCVVPKSYRRHNAVRTVKLAVVSSCTFE